MSQAKESQFEELSRVMLDRIEARLDEAGVDVESPATGILEAEFDDGSKIVINRHGVAREIWVAARTGGFHFRLDGELWVDTRSGEELCEKLTRLVAEQSGLDVRFA